LKNASAPTSSCGWLALLLIRIIETTTGETWHHIRRHLGATRRISS
jgi:hypothetical protein